MDPLTDVLAAFAVGRIDLQDMYNWLHEWQTAGMMRPDLICRAQEFGTQVCANAMQFLIMLTW